MAEAARSLPEPREAPQATHLRLVGPAPWRPAPPSAQVVRRRRALALAGLLALVVLPLAWLSLTGPGASDRQQISALLAAGATDPATLCDHLSAGALRATGGRAACVAASPSRGPGGSVGPIRVRSATATAVVGRGADAEFVRLVRQDGQWRVDDIR